MRTRPRQVVQSKTCSVCPVVIFDGDDTLWKTQFLYDRAKAQMAAPLSERIDRSGLIKKFVELSKDIRPRFLRSLVERHDVSLRFFGALCYSGCNIGYFAGPDLRGGSVTSNRRTDKLRGYLHFRYAPGDTLKHTMLA